MITHGNNQSKMKFRDVKYRLMNAEVTSVKSQGPAIFFGVVIGFLLAILIQMQCFKRYEDPYKMALYDAIGHEINLEYHDETHGYENSTVARQLYNDVKILCWIMTNPRNHKRKAQHVKKSWGRRCNKILFMSSSEDPELGSVALPVKEGRDNLWAKTKEAFKYIYQHHLDDADWFLKADDDTYVVVENLRYMLYEYSAHEPIYFGSKFRTSQEATSQELYMSGGAGYVLSKQAVIRFNEEGIPNKTICRSDAGGNEDVEIGLCLGKLNVTAGDSRDTNGQGRFFPYDPEAHLIPGHIKDPWFEEFSYYDPKQGMNCCSDNAISFHYVSPNQMYMLEYLIYHLRPYGIVMNPQPLPALSSTSKPITDAFVSSEESSVEV